MANETIIFSEPAQDLDGIAFIVTDMFYETTQTRAISFCAWESLTGTELNIEYPIETVRQIITALQKAVDVPTVQHSGKTYIFPELTKGRDVTVDIKEHPKDLLIEVSGLHYGDPILLKITEYGYVADGDEFGTWYYFECDFVWADDGADVEEDISETYNAAIKETVSEVCDAD